MLKVENLSKSFGAQKIFDDVSFTVLKGEKAGLTGRNGHGKTTLLRMLCSLEQPDTGEIHVPRGYRIGYVTQETRFRKTTLLDEGALGLPDHMGDETWRVRKVLDGLGFGRDDMEKDPGIFSDGYKIRLNLAKALLSEPDLLLLDEPTNYLDVVAIRWLIDFLKKWRGELILVTHDRSFMDAVATHILGIHRNKVRKIQGGTGKLYDQLLREEEVHEKTRINDERRRKETELFISRFRAKARLAGLVQSRIKALQRQKNLDKLERIKTLDFSFRYRPLQARSLFTARDISYGYPASERMLIRDLAFSVGAHDRIAVIGKNGKGKTTLLKVIAGELPPVTGEFNMHPQTSVSFFDQTKIGRLSEQCTVEEEIMNACGDRQRARDVAGAMLFEGDDALKQIRILSGGERSRVLLGTILASDTNLLLLDEPTNHLDMESCDALMAAIDEFPGAVIFVTHNELFLHSLANRFIVFQGERPSLFEGTYQDFLNRIGWDEESASAGAVTDAAAETGTDTMSRKNSRKARAEIQQRRWSELKPLEGTIARLEAAIGKLEREIARRNDEMIHLSAAGSGAAIGTLSIELHALKKNADALYDELDTATRDYEQRTALFDEELNGLDR
jgi:ATP-binding cassette, subfamily F, member 3